MAGKVTSIFISVLLFLVVAGFVWIELRLIRKWSGWWRVLAFLPAAALTFVIGNIIFSILKTPSAHNLWPFEIVMWSAGGLVFLGVLRVAKSFFSKS